MFNRKPSNEELRIAHAIDELLTEMKNEEGDTERYAALSEQLVKLTKLLQEVKKTKPSVSPDTVLLVVGNLVGIAIIVGHERAHVVTSKALSLLTKAR